MTTDLQPLQIAVLTIVSFGVGILGGFVGLALGTMRLPAMLLIGMPGADSGRHEHSRIGAVGD